MIARLFAMLIAVGFLSAPAAANISVRNACRYEVIFVAYGSVERASGNDLYGETKSSRGWIAVQPGQAKEFTNAVYMKERGGRVFNNEFDRNLPRSSWCLSNEPEFRFKNIESDKDCENQGGNPERFLVFADDQTVTIDKCTQDEIFAREERDRAIADQEAMDNAARDRRIANEAAAIEYLRRQQEIKEQERLAAEQRRREEEAQVAENKRLYEVRLNEELGPIAKLKRSEIGNILGSYTFAEQGSSIHRFAFLYSGARDGEEIKRVAEDAADFFVRKKATLKNNDRKRVQLPEGSSLIVGAVDVTTGEIGWVWVDSNGLIFRDNQEQIRPRPGRAERFKIFPGSSVGVIYFKNPKPLVSFVFE